MPEKVGDRFLLTLGEVKSDEKFQASNKEEKQKIFDAWILDWIEAMDEQLGDEFSPSDFLAQSRKKGVIGGKHKLLEFTEVLTKEIPVRRGELFAIRRPLPERRRLTMPLFLGEPEEPGEPGVPGESRISVAAKQIIALSNDVAVFEAQIKFIRRMQGDEVADVVARPYRIVQGRVQIAPRSGDQLPLRRVGKLVRLPTFGDMEAARIAEEDNKSFPNFPEMVSYIRWLRSQINRDVEGVQDDDTQAIADILPAKIKKMIWPDGTSREIREKAGVEETANIVITTNLVKEKKINTIMEEQRKKLNVRERDVFDRAVRERVGQLQGLEINEAVFDAFEESPSIFETILPEFAQKAIGQTIERDPGLKFLILTTNALSVGFIRTLAGVNKTISGFALSFSGATGTPTDLWFKSLGLTTEKSVRELQRDNEFIKARAIEGVDLRENIIVNIHEDFFEIIGSLSLLIPAYKVLSFAVFEGLNAAGQTFAHSGTGEEALEAGIFGGAHGLGLEIILRRFGVFKDVYARLATGVTFGSIAVLEGNERSQAISAFLTGLAMGRGRPSGARLIERERLGRGERKIDDKVLDAVDSIIEARLTAELGIPVKDALNIGHRVWLKNDKRKKLDPFEQKVMDIIAEHSDNAAGFFRGGVNRAIATEALKEHIKRQGAVVKKLPVRKLPIVDTPKEFANSGIKISKRLIDEIIKKDKLPVIRKKDLEVAKIVEPSRPDKLVPKEIPLEDIDALERFGYNEAEIERMNQGAIDDIIVRKLPAEGQEITAEGDIAEIRITEDSPEFRRRLQELEDMGLANDPEARDLILTEIDEVRFPKPEFTPAEINEMINVNIKGNDANELIRLAESLPATEEFARQKREALEAASDIQDLDQGLGLAFERVNRFNDEGGFIRLPSLKEIREGAGFVFQDLKTMARKAYDQSGGRFSKYLQHLRVLSKDLWDNIKGFAGSLFNEVKKTLNRNVEEALGIKPAKRMPEEPPIEERRPVEEEIPRLEAIEERVPKPTEIEIREAEIRETERREVAELEVGERIKSSQTVSEMTADLLAEAEKRPKALGRPELAQISPEEPVRNLVAAADEARKRLDVPERETFEQWTTQADKELAVAGERERIISEGIVVDDPVQVMKAQKIITEEGLKAINSGDKAKIADIALLINDYRTGRTVTARALAAGRDMHKTPEERSLEWIIDNLYLPKVRVRIKLKGKTREEKRKILEKDATRIIKIKDNLKKIGVDIDSLTVEELGDPIKVSQIIREIQTANASPADKAYEWWLNSILSNPVTHVVNQFGNFANAGWDFTFQRMGESLVNIAVRDPGSAQLSEYPFILKGIMPGIIQGYKNAMLTLRTEQPTFRGESFDPESPSKIEITDRGKAIKGMKGRVVRVPTTGLLGADDFAKTLFWNMEVGARAHRIAKAEGLKGDDLARRMQQEISDPYSKASMQAYERALELTFQTKLGAFGQFVIRARKEPIIGLPIRFIIPFVTTPVNIAKLGFRKSPLGAVNFLWKASTGKLKGEGARLFTEQIFAWGTFMYIYSLFLGDEDEIPFVTGSAPPFSDKAKRDFQRGVIPPQSIRIGDEWFSYARIEPFATTLTLTVDGIARIEDARNGKEFDAVIGESYQNIIGQFRDKTFLKGIGDLIRAYESEQRFVSFISNWTTSWVPNVIRAPVRQTDQLVRDYRNRDKNLQWLKTTGIRTLQKAFPAEKLPFTDIVIAPPPKIDVWGNEIIRYDGQFPQSSFLFRALTPARVEIVRADNDLDMLILNWNNANPNDTFYPGQPANSFTFKGEKIEMGESQYNEFLRASGQLAAQRLIEMSLNFDDPTEEDIKTIKREIMRARSDVKIELFGLPKPRRRRRRRRRERRERRELR